MVDNLGTLGKTDSHNYVKSSQWLTNISVLELVMDYDYFKSLDDREFDIQVHEAVVASGVPNYKGCHIPLRTKLNISYLKEQLFDFHDAVVSEIIRVWISH